MLRNGRYIQKRTDDNFLCTFWFFNGLCPVGSGKGNCFSFQVFIHVFERRIAQVETFNFFTIAFAGSEETLRLHAPTFFKTGEGGYAFYAKCKGRRHARGCSKNVNYYNWLIAQIVKMHEVRTQTNVDGFYVGGRHEAGYCLQFRSRWEAEWGLPNNKAWHQSSHAFSFSPFL